MRSANPVGRFLGAWLRLGPRRQRAGLALLALLLVQAQALGLWHRVAHGGPAMALVGAVQAAAPDAGALVHAHHGHHDHDGHAAHPGAHGLFGHDEGDESGCRLFDPLTAADALLAASPLLGFDRPATGAAAPLSSPVAGRTPRPYQARAPPRA